MGTRFVNHDGTEIRDAKLVFVCDNCGNTAPFMHGMEVFVLPNSEPNISYCSTICVQYAQALARA